MTGAGNRVHFTLAMTLLAASVVNLLLSCAWL
jgi:hypothetical protein